MWVLARLLTDLHTLIVICFWFIRQLVKSFHSFHWSPCTNQMVGGGGGGGWFSLHLFVYLQDWEISLHLLVYLRDWEISPDLRWDFCMCKTCPSKFWPRNENNCYLTGSGAKLSWREGVGGERINQSIFKSGQWHCFLGDWRLLFFSLFFFLWYDIYLFVMLNDAYSITDVIYTVYWPVTPCSECTFLLAFCIECKTEALRI